MAVFAAGVVIFTGCGSQEEQVTPDQVRDALTSVTHDSADLLKIDGWTESGVPSAGSCADGLNWEYIYGAPAPDGAPLDDAQTVADYWKSLGMTVRVNTEHDPVVFANGGSLRGISFSTGPGNYHFSGTTLCVPGDPDDYR